MRDRPPKEAPGKLFCLEDWLFFFELNKIDVCPGSFVERA